MDPRPGPGYGYRQMFIESFFGRFATLEVGYPERVYTLIQAVCCVGLCRPGGDRSSGAGAAVRARWARSPCWRHRGLDDRRCCTSRPTARWSSGPDPLITGRYLLPLVTVFGLGGGVRASRSLRPRLSALARDVRPVRAARAQPRRPDAHVRAVLWVGRRSPSSSRCCWSRRCPALVYLTEPREVIASTPSAYTGPDQAAGAARARRGVRRRDPVRRRRAASRASARRPRPGARASLEVLAGRPGRRPPYRSD